MTQLKTLFLETMMDVTPSTLADHKLSTYLHVNSSGMACEKAAYYSHLNEQHSSQVNKLNIYYTFFFG